MPLGDWLVLVLILQYILIALAYFLAGNAPKTLYFLGATLLSLGVLWMR